MHKDDWEIEEALHYLETRILRLPTLETQMVEWLKVCDRSNIFRRKWIGKSGFKLYADSQLKEFEGKKYSFTVIANISIPGRFHKRGWFKRFEELLFVCTPHDGLIIENVYNEGWKKSLINRGWKLGGPDNRDLFILKF